MEGKPVDVLTVTEQLAKNGTLEQVGDRLYQNSRDWYLFQRHTLKSFIFHYKSQTSVTSPLVAFVKFSFDEDYSRGP